VRSRVAVTTRRGGVSVAPYDANNLADHVGDDPSAVAANRGALASALGVARVVFMRQVHGAGVAVVDASSPGVVDGVDALVTNAPGVALAVLVADCVPVLLAGDGAVAAVHAGRRGLAGGVVVAAVEALAALGAGDVQAHVGPSVCGACYEVPESMQDDVCDRVPQARCRTRAGTPGLDLRAGVVASLLGCGVRRVVVDGTCTVEDPAYYSHRRDGVTGRFAGVVVLER
jgi:YfiH family protein